LNGVTIVDVDQAAGRIESVDDLVIELLADGLDLAVVRHEGEVTAYIASERVRPGIVADAAKLGRQLDQEIDPQPRRIEPTAADRGRVDVDGAQHGTNDAPPSPQVGGPVGSGWHLYRHAG